MKRARDMATIRRTAAEFVGQCRRQLLHSISIASRSASVTIPRVDAREAKFRCHCCCDPPSSLGHGLSRRARGAALRSANTAQRYTVASTNINGGYHGSSFSS